MIRTPDQRLRVFVSSTLRELADERAAVRTAIERMHLAPVMFELGARPHPPRALYRSYLAQSDVFVGIYADSYGWVAPGEDVSGLEDEYNLAPPRHAEAHLHQAHASIATSGSTELIDRIRATTPPRTSRSTTPTNSQSGWWAISPPSSPSASTSPEPGDAAEDADASASLDRPRPRRVHDDDRP